MRRCGEGLGRVHKRYVIPKGCKGVSGPMRGIMWVKRVHKGDSRIAAWVREGA